MAGATSTNYSLYKLDANKLRAAHMAAKEDGSDNVFFKVGDDHFVASGAALKSQKVGDRLFLNGIEGRVEHVNQEANSYQEFKAQNADGVAKARSIGEKVGFFAGALAGSAGFFAGGVLFGLACGAALSFVGLKAGRWLGGLIGGGSTSGQALVESKRHSSDLTRMAPYGEARPAGDILPSLRTEN